MLLEEHIETAKDFLDAAEKEYASGERLQAFEKLWGAASHATLALARQRGGPVGGHRDLRNLIWDVSKSESGPDLRAGFSIAEKCHANFYHDFMSYDDEFAVSRELVGEFVDAVLGLVNGEAQPQNGQESG